MQLSSMWMLALLVAASAGKPPALDAQVGVQPIRTKARVHLEPVGARDLARAVDAAVADVVRF